jgi:ectoine hydroxylase-related dioxygenase (phytanoyl-CoA dioxygenase family)
VDFGGSVRVFHVHTAHVEYRIFKPWQQSPVSSPAHSRISASAALLHLTSGFNGPDAFDFCASDAVNTVVHVDGGAHMIRQYSQTVAHAILTCGA